jgi:hypothetical protein
MNNYQIKQLGLILAEYTRVLGMQAENMIRGSLDQSMAYSEIDFQLQANQIEFLARQLD